jgi:hypothetical protein
MVDRPRRSARSHRRRPFRHQRHCWRITFERDRSSSRDRLQRSGRSIREQDPGTPCPVSHQPQAGGSQSGAGSGLDPHRVMPGCRRRGDHDLSASTSSATGFVTGRADQGPEGIFVLRCSGPDLVGLGGTGGGPQRRPHSSKETVPPVGTPEPETPVTVVRSVNV